MTKIPPPLKANRFELKVYFGLGLLVLAFLPLLFYAFYSLSDIASERKQIVLRNSEELILAERLAKEFNSQLSLVPLFVLSGDRKLLTDYKDNETRSFALIDRLNKISESPEERTALEGIRATAQRLNLVFEEGARMREKGASIATLHAHFSEKGGPLSTELRTALDSFTDDQTHDLSRAEVRLTNHTNNLIVGLVLVCVLVTFSVALISLLLVRIVRAKERADLEQDRVFLHEIHLSNARKEAVETVAHDLRNPLAAMRLRMELLRKKISLGTADLPGAEKELGSLLRVTDSMQRLIQDFLDHAKIEAGRLLLVRSSCEPAALLREVADNLAPLAHARGLELQVLPSAPLPVFQCDSDRIRQALENLVGNAIKFTPTQGVITLQAGTNSRHIIFSVSDTGPGIPKEKLKNIFNRYWQDNAATRSGTGLGLAIVSGIAKAHGGNVFAESVVGKGTTFHLYIPALQPEAEEVDFVPPEASDAQHDSHVS